MDQSESVLLAGVQLDVNKFEDVTLFSDDLIAFQAHKIVLCSASPVLRKLIFNNPHQHPLIYLKNFKA